MAFSVLDAVTAALKEISVLAAGETPDAGDATDAMNTLNRLVDQWGTEDLLMFQVVRTVFSLTASKQTYTIGTSGSPDVNIARPVYLEHVNYQNTSVSPTLELQLNPLTEDAWSRLPQRTLTAPFPTHWYYDFAYPNANLSWWPVPTSATLQGVLYASTAVAQFAALTTQIALPPGYARMIVKNLALELAPSYEKQADQLLLAQAADAKAGAKRANKKLLDMSIEAAALVQGASRTFAYNINTGP